MSRHCNWRDCQEWSRYGLPFSTTSNEACKLYDAALTQYVGFYDEKAFGGLIQTLKQLEAADPQNVMGHVISLGLDLAGTSVWPRSDEAFRKRLRSLVDLAAGSDVTDWEKRHVKAIQLWADGYTSAACGVWEDILMDFPFDLLAAKFNFDNYIFLGKMPERRDVNARTLAQWKRNMPHYGYLMGMYAFSLCETNSTTKAEDFAKQALDMNPWDTWATHSLAHVYETENRYTEGIRLFESSEGYWAECESLACHNYWHWALYNTELGNYEAALDIYDNQIVKRALKGRSTFNLSDVSSLLFRLELQDQGVGDRWQEIFPLCEGRLSPNQVAFYDPHIIMTCTGADKADSASTMLEAIREFSKNGDTDPQRVKRDVGSALCDSLVAYRRGDYAEAVSLLYPIRYEVYQIGGSNAQRDVFNQLLIHAAMKSTKHKSLGRNLILERKQLMVQDSPLTERLVSSLMS